MRAPLLLAFAASLLAPAVDAAVHGAERQAGPGMPAGERLVAEVPPGWFVAATNRTASTSTEMLLPEGQTEAGWTDAIAVVRLAGAPPPPLTEFYAMAEQDFAARCALAPGIGRPQENADDRGYAAAFQLLICPRSKDAEQGEVMMYKVTRGEEGTYQVQRAWRMPAQESVEAMQIQRTMLDQGAAYLKSVHLCDTRREDRPCPALLR
jgi:hypothetical protein